MRYIEEYTVYVYYILLLCSIHLKQILAQYVFVEWDLRAFVYFKGTL